MRAATGIEALEITAVMMGREEKVYPTLIWDEQNVILVDTGYPGQLPNIREAVEQSGVAWDSLSMVVITHQDVDHIGSLPSIVAEFSGKVQVLASEFEKPFIQGEKRLLKITPEAIEQAVSALPPEVPEAWRSAFRATLEQPPKAAVDRVIEDGEELPYCGGITVIATPGHTPGHVSLYHKASKTLIAADALVIAEGELQGSVPELSTDPQEAVRSLKKLAHLDVESVICYHGGRYKGNAKQRIFELSEG